MAHDLPSLNTFVIPFNGVANLTIRLDLLVIDLVILLRVMVGLPSWQRMPY